MKGYSDMTKEEQESYVKALESDVQKGEALERLLKNDDFILIFRKNYVEKEPARLTALLAEPTINADALKRKNVEERLLGIAHFSNFIREQTALAVHAQNNLYRIQHPEEFTQEGEEE